jgi:hypothetical protein
MTPKDLDRAPYWVTIKKCDEKVRFLQIERFDKGYGRDGGGSDDVDGSGRPFSEAQIADM